MSRLRRGGPGAAGFSSSTGPAADDPKEQERGPGGLRGDEGPHEGGAVRPGRQGQEEEAEAGGGRRGGLQQVGLLLRRLEQRGQEVDGKIEHEEDGEQTHEALRSVPHRAAGRAVPDEPGEGWPAVHGKSAPRQGERQQRGEAEAQPGDAPQLAGISAADGLCGGRPDGLGAAPGEAEEKRVDARMGQRQGGRRDVPGAGRRDVQRQDHEAREDLLQAQYAAFG